MGQTDVVTPTNLIQPPRLSSSTSKYEWRRTVRVWARRVQEYARGGDSKSQGVANSLGLTLYAFLEHSFQQVVDRAIDVGQLRIETTNYTNKDTPDPEQLIIVEKIISLVAKDTRTDSVRRLVRLNRQIQHCTRKESETYRQYAERFRGLAQEYLNAIGARNEDQNSQTFALLLLENAHLPQTTFNTLVTSLVGRVRTTARPENFTWSMSKSEMETIQKVLGPITKPNIKSNQLFSVEVSDEDREQIKALMSRVSSALSPSTSHMVEQALTQFIGLDEAVEALKDVTIETSAVPFNTYEGSYDQNPPAYRSTMMGSKKEKTPNKRPWSSDQRSRITKNLRCYACGKRGHYARDHTEDELKKINQIKEEISQSVNLSDKPTTVTAGDDHKKSVQFGGKTAPTSPSYKGDHSQNDRGFADFFRKGRSNS